MNDILKQDVFFFVTTIAVGILTIVLIVGIFYVIKILRDVKFITKKAKAGAEIISEDLSVMKEKVKKHGPKAAFLFSFFKNVYNKKTKKKGTR